MRNPNTLDLRETIPFDYHQMSIEDLEALKCNLWHSLVDTESGVVAMHREYTAVKLALKEARALEQFVTEGVQHAHE